MKFENTKETLAIGFVAAVGMFIFFGSMVGSMELAIRWFDSPMPWGMVIWVAFLGVLFLTAAIIFDLSTQSTPKPKQGKKSK